MDWCRTLLGAWLLLRASQLWAPVPDNDPDGARACMRRFYALVRLSYGEPASPAKAAALEVDWWRVHRQVRYPRRQEAPETNWWSRSPVCTAICSASQRPRSGREIYRARAMGLSDQWVEDGCLPGSPLLPQEHASLVSCYAALLAAVHH